ncbi:MAG: hypothetical protein AAGB04_29060 [Pseudomonadota bacterium]
MAELYNFLGVPVQSDFRIPEAVIQSGDLISKESVTVRIRSGHVGDGPTDGRKFGEIMRANERVCYYNFYPHAKFLIEDGCSITVEMYNGARETDMRVFLLGSAFGTLLHQRKAVPLHVSSIESSKGVVAFTGDSGAGKSTIAAYIHKHKGTSIFSDDVASVIELKPKVTVACGLMRLKLWRDAIDLATDVIEVEKDLLRDDKYQLIQRNAFHRSQSELAAIVSLEVADEVSIERVEGPKALDIVVGSIYRPYLIPLFNDQAHVFSSCARIAKSTEIFSLRRPWDKSTIPDCISALEKSVF